MTGGHPHPSRPGEPNRATARVRHRGSGREGCIADGVPAREGEVAVLFDGAAVPVSTHPRKLDYLDAPTSNPGAHRP